MILSELARAKINIALHVLGRRADGYHNLDSIVAFATAGDVLTFEPAAQFSLTVTGPFADGVPTDGDNIIAKAVGAFSAEAGHLAEGVRITLDKRLPVASGIGGGSADAAATLRGLNRMTGSTLDRARLERIALGLGADVPVCIGQRQVRMRGVGDVLEPFPMHLSDALVLVNPGAGLSTQEVFGALGLAKASLHRSEIDPTDPQSWRNDLTDAALTLRPVINDVIAILLATGVFETVRMSGSGATCFGLCQSLALAERAARSISANHPDWWCVAGGLS